MACLELIRMSTLTRVRCPIQGESTPSAYFYQNLAEAEYVCATYQYMRLLGYPAHTVTVLTTYNGQRHLLQDVFQLK